MRGQGNYPPLPSLQQNPAAASVPPPRLPFHHGPFTPQHQVIQQGHDSFQHPPGGSVAYQHPQLPGASYSSTSNFSMSYSYGSSMLVPRHSYPQPLGPLPPPPPPPPTYSPPRIPPLPPSSPALNNPSMIDGSRSMVEDSSYGDKLVLNRPSPKLQRDNCVDERNEKEVKAADAIATRSPADSDMDMEDDITQPDEEKQKDLYNNLNDAVVSMREEPDEKEQLQDSHHTAGNEVPNVVVDGDIIFARSSVPKDQTLGTEIQSGCDIPSTGKECSESNGLGLKIIGVTEQTMDVIVKKSPQHEKVSQPNVPVIAAETGREKLSSDLNESANAFKLLEAYATDSSTENGGKNLLQDVSPPTFKVEPKTLSKSPRNAMKADKTSFSTGKREELAENSCGNQESIAVEGGKGNSAKLHVDEFGRLVREGASDSDTSNSPRHTRQRVRRDRKRSRSRSSSYSPRDRRRRERRGRSRSCSPRRRRSRSRTPALRRGSEYDRSRDKGQVAECFDFKKGKCYRGATCRYSHHESYKSERVRHNRTKQNPDFNEEDNKLHPSRSSVHENVGTKDEGPKLPQDKPNLRDVKVPDELPAEIESSSIQKYSGKVPQINQECKTVEDSLVYESFSPVQNFTVQTSSVASPMTKLFTTEEVPSRSNLPLPPVSMNIPFSQPISQDYNFPPPYQAPMPYQTSHFPLPSNSSSSSFLLPPPPPPPSHFTVNATTGEHSIPSMNMNQSLRDPRKTLPSYTSIRPYPTEFPSQPQTLQYQPYPYVHGPGQISHGTDDFNSSSFPVSNITGQSQSNFFHGSIGVNMPANTNPSQRLPYFQPASYGQQYCATNGTSSQVGEPAKVSFLEMTPQSHCHDFVEFRNSNQFNPYPSTFDQLTKFNSQGNERPGYDQYDPLFDSIEPPSNSFIRDGLQNNETIGDSDNIQRSNESSKVLNREHIKQEGDTAVSANDSLDFEGIGETGDVEVGDVVNGSPGTPNNAMEMHAGEVEIDQVKDSGKKNRSTKLFKISIAIFVKEVLKPSWRQGNMSKEAFKTIVKKTVDKVSSAMKSHKIPRSQSKINQYIDSSRGKLTKLVMGYVDKYVKM